MFLGAMGSGLLQRVISSTTNVHLRNPHLWIVIIEVDRSFDQYSSTEIQIPVHC